MHCPSKTHKQFPLLPFALDFSIKIDVFVDLNSRKSTRFILVYACSQLLLPEGANFFIIFFDFLFFSDSPCFFLENLPSIAWSAFLFPAGMLCLSRLIQPFPFRENACQMSWNNVLFIIGIYYPRWTDVFGFGSILFEKCMYVFGEILYGIILILCVAIQYGAIFLI